MRFDSLPNSILYVLLAGTGLALQPSNTSMRSKYLASLRWPRQRSLLTHLCFDFTASTISDGPGCFLPCLSSPTPPSIMSTIYECQEQTIDSLERAVIEHKHLIDELTKRITHLNDVVYEQEGKILALQAELEAARGEAKTTDSSPEIVTPSALPDPFRPLGSPFFAPPPAIQNFTPKSLPFSEQGGMLAKRLSFASSTPCIHRLGR